MYIVTTKERRKLRNKLALLLTLFIVISVYVGCSYAFRYPFVGMLPAEFETHSATYVVDEGWCGIAIFELNEKAQTKILQNETGFFGSGMEPRVKRKETDTYHPWEKTPLPSAWTNAEIGKDMWSGVGCSKDNELRAKVVRAAWQDGGYYTSLNRGHTTVLAFPKLGLVVVSYMSI